MNQRRRNPLVHYGILFLIYAVGLLTLASHTFLHALGSNPTSAVTVKRCASYGQTWQLTISSQGFIPASLSVNRCDRIELLSTDNGLHSPAFGEHEHHLAYPGFSEKIVAKGRPNTFIASQTGSFEIHDHLNDSLAATLIVK